MSLYLGMSQPEVAPRQTYGHPHFTKSLKVKMYLLENLPSN